MCWEHPVHLCELINSKEDLAPAAMPSSAVGGSLLAQWQRRQGTVCGEGTQQCDLAPSLAFSIKLNQTHILWDLRGMPQLFYIGGKNVPHDNGVWSHDLDSASTAGRLFQLFLFHRAKMGKNLL